jgi:hypothetical protein
LFFKKKLKISTEEKIDLVRKFIESDEDLLSFSKNHHLNKDDFAQWYNVYKYGVERELNQIEKLDISLLVSNPDKFTDDTFILFLDTEKLSTGQIFIQFFANEDEEALFASCKGAMVIEGDEAILLDAQEMIKSSCNSLIDKDIVLAQIKDINPVTQNLEFDNNNSATSTSRVGLFEFALKRGRVDASDLDDDDIIELVNELKELCRADDYKGACESLLDWGLCFEFDLDSLDDEPERYFSSMDMIEVDCNESNTSVKIGLEDDDLILTLVVKFEAFVEDDISAEDFEEYLPDSGAWAAASASPGWSYSESDGENVYFVGFKK